MNSQEFAQDQIEKIDRARYRIQAEIEALMTTDEFLSAQRDKWLGRTAVQDVVEYPPLKLIQGGMA